MSLQDLIMLSEKCEELEKKLSHQSLVIEKLMRAINAIYDEAISSEYNWLALTCEHAFKEAQAKLEGQ